MISLERGDWQTLGNEASEIRRVVFIEEQQVPQEEEWDGRDDACEHFLVHLDGRTVGTARLLPDGHVGRVAILSEARGLGLGQRLMEAVIHASRQAGHAEVLLDAQTHALEFYQRLGFTAYGDEFLEAGIPHRSMRLILN
ncbi:GNAT family N-acetyltransferase [Cobetia amphilecti]|uniref:GNAT family N-acetyltransferase n=1 Tax=Cobetia amphilecti TaxID=1055104 RepID=UPI00255111DC|nr:GNAT family N-acetyltransferase [Cobetia amphilecti]